MPERLVSANGIEICCEDFGDPADPSVLLVMGASTQSIHWPDDFCAALVAGGRHVIRYDNRDTGRSTCFDYGKHPYTLADMALDALGVLDAFGIERAHLVGASMGGMIGQILAIEHRERLRTLTAMLSTPSSASFIRGWTSEEDLPLPPPAPRFLEWIGAHAADPPKTPEGRIAASVQMWRVLAGSAQPFDEAAVRVREARVEARAVNPGAEMNHPAAIAASPDRFEALRGVTTPTLVIQGSEDPIFSLPHGRALAEAIPGARLLVIDGLGHELPPWASQRIAQAILEHTA
jgi:pimeloyl-ACP methyl ester carboxylesterase